MIDNNSSGPSPSIVTAAVADSSNGNTSLLYDTTDMSASAGFQDSHWSNSNNNSNNNNCNNDIEQNKRKRNGSLDSLKDIEQSVPPSQRDQQVILDESLSKPGRKPLTENVFDDDDEDPKAKRKVQNRAAQRAFRERKERYVRDLEMKIRQIQNQHLHTTTQLSRENQYLRAVIHRLKAELCSLKGLPLDSYADVIPPLPAWQHATSAPTPSASPLSSDLAPFLTMGGTGGPHSPITPTLSRPRPVAIAPAGTPPSPVSGSAKRPIAAAKRRPVPILPQTQETKKSTSSDQHNDLVQQQQQQLHQHHHHHHQQHSHQHQLSQQQYLPNNNNNNALSSLSSMSFSNNNNNNNSNCSASSHPALYVQFSPEEKLQDDFTSTSTTATVIHGRRSNIPSVDPYLSSDVNLFNAPGNNDLALFSNTSQPGNHGNDNSGGSSSSSNSRSSHAGSHGARSPPLPPQQPVINTRTRTTAQAPPRPVVPQKQDTTEKNAVAEEDESQRTRVQTVWRRLNLYGRFSDFDFDQLSRVAQMADHRDGPQLTMGGGVPLMEDWELDKLMLQIDSDHL